MQKIKVFSAEYPELSKAFPSNLHASSVIGLKHLQFLPSWRSVLVQRKVKS